MGKNLLKFGIVLGTSFVLFSCGGNSSENNISTTSDVSFFITDKPDTDIEEVNITIEKVAFENTGNGNECVLFEYDQQNQEINPLENINLLELQDSYLFVNEKKCKKATYNRLRIDFDRQVSIKKNGEMYNCTVEGFDRGSGKQPNKPHCVGSKCYVELNGEVNIAANVENVAVDFDIKKSKIVIDNSKNCSITFKLTPLHIDKQKMKEKKMRLKGYVENLDEANKKFTIHFKRKEFTVNYTNVNQENIDSVLELAYENNFDRRILVGVKCENFNKEEQLCEAEKVILILKHVQIENLDEQNKTFDINLENNQMVKINYSNADVEGTLSNGTEIKAVIDSSVYNQIDGVYIYNAEKIRVE
jgi:hypothetical protein